MEEMSHEEVKEAATTTQAGPSSPLSDNKDEPRTPRTRSLRDLYEVTNELHLVCLLADAEDITFEQAVKDEKWQAAMSCKRR